MPTATSRAPALDLPRVKFRTPPVIETILGVQFAPVSKLNLPHFGLFWGEVRDDYPTQEIKPPLAPVIEEFPAPPPGLTIQLQSEPEARCWFMDATSTQLIQIQRDRFLRNWRKGPPPDDGYPSYDDLRPRFERDWERFVSFLHREGLSAPDVNQCEVTYVNHIDLGQGWDSFGDVAEVLTLWAKPTGPFLPHPEMATLTVRYVMPERAGRLHVAAQPAIRRRDGKEVLQLTLTARGRPASPRIGDILAWFDLGHDWIVHGFAEITTAKMRKIWGQL